MQWIIRKLLEQFSSKSKSMHYKQSEQYLNSFSYRSLFISWLNFILLVCRLPVCSCVHVVFFSLLFHILQTYTHTIVIENDCILCFFMLFLMFLCSCNIKAFTSFHAHIWPSQKQHKQPVCVEYSFHQNENHTRLEEMC